MRLNETESDVLRALCEYLELRRHTFFRVNNIPVYMPERQAFRALPKYTPKGIPDIILIKDGWFVGLEVKTKTGKQSPDQKAFEKNVHDAGGEYYVVRTIEDLQEVGL